jgi:hypothetical protein
MRLTQCNYRATLKHVPAINSRKRSNGRYRKASGGVTNGKIAERDRGAPSGAFRIG